MATESGLPMFAELANFKVRRAQTRFKVALARSLDSPPARSFARSLTHLRCQSSKSLQAKPASEATSLVATFASRRALYSIWRTKAILSTNWKRARLYLKASAQNCSKTTTTTTTSSLLTSKQVQGGRLAGKRAIFAQSVAPLKRGKATTTMLNIN